MKYKVEDLKNKIKYFELSIVSVQKTHYRRKGQFKLDYVVFEAIRKHKEKGGSMLIVHENLKPVLIKEFNDIFEMVVVEVNSDSKPNQSNNWVRTSGKLGRNGENAILDCTGRRSCCIRNKWKRLKKKLPPVVFDPPTAMKNSSGGLIYTEDGIKKEAVSH